MWKSVTKCKNVQRIREKRSYSRIRFRRHGVDIFLDGGAERHSSNGFHPESSNLILNHPKHTAAATVKYCEQANKKNRCKSCLLRRHAGKTDSCTDSQRGLHWLHSTILCASLCITAAGPVLLCVYILLLCSLSKLSLNTVNNTLCVYVLPVLAIAVLLMKYTFIVKRTL